MAFTDKPESANEAQDHSQPLDDGGFFSLNDVIMQAGIRSPAPSIS